MWPACSYFSRGLHVPGEGVRLPLLKEITIGVDNVRLTQFMLNECHYMR